MSKKILLISQNFYPEIGSAGNRTKNIYLLLKEKKYDVSILTTDPTYPNRNLYDDESFWDDQELNKESPKIKRVKINNKKYSRNIINRLFYYLEMAIKMLFYILFNKNKYDVIYTTSPPIFVAIVGLIAKYKYRARLLFDVRDLWPESLKGVGVFNNTIILYVFNKIEKLLYSKADEIIVNSEGFIAHIESKSTAFKNKITYIPNGARLKEIKKDLSEVDNFKVIYAGNIGLAQDDKILMELAYELNKRKIEFTIIGYGLRRQGLKDFINEKGLTKTTFVDPLTREACLKLISEHQVGIVTLMDRDVFKTVLPGKVIDYMTCGVPIVGSVSGFPKDIITQEKAGFVSENNDVHELLNYINKLIEDPNLQRETSENGKDFVRKKFLWESNIKSLYRLID